MVYDATGMVYDIGVIDIDLNRYDLILEYCHCITGSLNVK